MVEVASWSRSSLAEMLQDFQRADTTSTGVLRAQPEGMLDLQEVLGSFKELFPCHGACGDQDRSRMFQEIDKDNDGFLSFAEYVEFRRAASGEEDVDVTGLLDQQKEEILRLRQALTSKERELRQSRTQTELAEKALSDLRSARRASLAAVEAREKAARRAAETRASEEISQVRARAVSSANTSSSVERGKIGAGRARSTSSAGPYFSTSASVPNAPFMFKIAEDGDVSVSIDAKDSDADLSFLAARFLESDLLERSLPSEKDRYEEAAKRWEELATEREQRIIKLESVLKGMESVQGGSKRDLLALKADLSSKEIALQKLKENNSSLDAMLKSQENEFQRQKRELGEKERAFHQAKEVFHQAKTEASEKLKKEKQTKEEELRRATRESEQALEQLEKELQKMVDGKGDAESRARNLESSLEEEQAKSEGLRRKVEAEVSSRYKAEARARSLESSLEEERHRARSGDSSEVVEKLSAEVKRLTLELAKTRGGRSVEDVEQKIRDYARLVWVNRLALLKEGHGETDSKSPVSRLSRISPVSVARVSPASANAGVSRSPLPSYASPLSGFRASPYRSPNRITSPPVTGYASDAELDARKYFEQGLVEAERLRVNSSGYVSEAYPVDEGVWDRVGDVKSNSGRKAFRVSSPSFAPSEQMSASSSFSRPTQSRRPRSPIELPASLPREAWRNE